MPRRFPEPYREPDLVRGPEVSGLWIAFGVALLVGLVTGAIWIGWNLLRLHVLP